MKLSLTCTDSILRNVKNVEVGGRNPKLWQIQLLSLFSVSGRCSQFSRYLSLLGDGRVKGQFPQGPWTGECVGGTRTPIDPSLVRPWAAR